MNTERKLATIRRITALDAIPGADKIEVATVDGWRVVVKKDSFKVNELAVFCEVDSWVPTTVAPFLTKPGHTPKEFEGVAGERLRTVKLRGQLSQGLLLKISDMVETAGCWSQVTEGDDVSEWLGVVKWEKPIPANMVGVMRGNFPTKLQKTDQPRIQNLSRELEKWIAEGAVWEVTEKLDGTSSTFWLDEDGVFHVCSRNVDLVEDTNNLYWQVAKKYCIEEKLRMCGAELHGVAIQGEICGPGIQGNQYGLTEPTLYVFALFESQTGTYCDSDNRQAIVKYLGLQHAPILGRVNTDDEYSVQKLLEIAKGTSVINGSVREGLVFQKVDDPSVSFKAINNDWLLANE